MKKLRIALEAEHAGLIDLLDTILEDHDVRLYPKWDHYPRTWQGDEDIVISTLPYRSHSLNTGKPTICYFTDPSFYQNKDEVQRLFDDKRITVIGAENCYPDDLFIRGVSEFIPFAIRKDDYPRYNGSKRCVAVINRKPRERWEQVVRGATGVGMSLEEFLGDIPFEIVSDESETRFRQHYADNRVLFYFSNSPFTIVMFEAMAVGMPIVAFDHHHRWDHVKPIHKYLAHYSTDMDEIRSMLSGALAGDFGEEKYPLSPDFGEVQSLWNKLFEKTLNR